ncbi:MAG TPA: protein-ADP-ribose hydrolase [Candidatus Borkfalkia faecigallinarum]|uniref:Protein-ADP-ribose hydrolase n=1 Tax=Candidatus Borkfalkia faecigallinarum TaxID=2838509 RepID=A0A9D2AR44_9FIRM|nr:protein-ADP-ribose hydrolase [Candidatus Borkfalkia faecigallinarum]
MLSLKEYKEIIDLNYRPRPAAELTEEEKSVICDEMLGVLLEERNEIAAFSYPYRVKRDLIWGYLNERMPNPVSSRFLEIQDKLFRAESVERGVVDVSSLDYREGIALWQGDITRLNADAIVNAANNSLLGCFIPHHKCIDNVIHSRAGVQVRLDCSKIMGAQGEAEPSGCAKITLAYNLPSKYILHTVGPMVGVRVTDEDRRVLRNCYISCLNLAREMGLHTVAFCCISTGIFGFPGDEAAAIAVGAVKGWLLEAGGCDMRVVFDVYLDRDLAIYRDVLTNT